jgi:hypothetical protein
MPHTCTSFRSKGWRLVLYGYLAVSGDQEDSAICCLCGFIAEADAWDRIDHAWQALLADSSTSFDAIACLHGTSVYQSCDVSRRHDLLAKLSSTLARSALVPVGSFVLREHFSRLSYADRAVLTAEGVDSPMDLIFSDLTERTIHRVLEESEKISFVLDREPQSAAGRYYDQLFNKHLGRYLLGPHLCGTLAFADAQGCNHLQAARLLGETVLLMEKRKSFSPKTSAPFELPPGLQQLGEQIYQQGRFDAVELDRLIAKMKSIRRQSE